MNVRFIKNTIFSGKITAKAVEGLKDATDNWILCIKELGFMQIKDEQIIEIKEKRNGSLK